MPENNPAMEQSITPQESYNFNTDNDNRITKTITVFNTTVEVTIPAGIGGRPAKINEDVIKRLYEAYAFGCQDDEACYYAGIAPSTLYNFQKDNNDFLELKYYIKQNPILKARMTLFKHLDDPNFAWKYLNKKAPDLQDTNMPTVQLAVQVNNLVNEDREKYK